MSNYLLSGGEFNLSFVILALSASAVLIILNGIFVAYEFAVIAAKKSVFEAEEIASRRTSKASLKSLSDLSMQLAGAQLGITIASLALGKIGEPAFESLIELALGSSVSEEVAKIVGFAVALTVITFLHLVIGEMVPKNIALSAPEATLRWLVIPYRIYLFVFRPFASFLNGLANVGCRLFGITPKDELFAVRTASELAKIVGQSTQEGIIEQDDGDLLQGVLAFSETKVADVVNPSSTTQSAKLGVSAKELEKIVASSTQTRIPIKGLKGDQYLGYIHARDLLKIQSSKHLSPFPTELVRQMAVVRAEQPLIEVLRLMRRLRRQLAVVVDDAGTLGFISIEQLMEAILGTTDKQIQTKNNVK